MADIGSIIEWDDSELDALNIDKVELERLINQLIRVSNKLKKTGLTLYANDYGVSILHPDRPGHTVEGVQQQENVIAYVPMRIDGGGW